MKKLVLLFILMSFALPSHAWFWDKKDKALEAELQGKGYAGTLPDVNKNLQPKQKKVSTPIFESQEGFNNPSDLKPVPKDNPAFINIISKKDKTSAYIIDANEMIPLLEKLVDAIEEEIKKYDERVEHINIHMEPAKVKKKKRLNTANKGMNLVDKNDKKG